MAAFTVGCGTQGTPDEEVATSDQAVCARVEGVALGQRITVDVPSIDATMPVTFTAWITKGDDPSQYVAFSLDVTANFTVKAGDNTFEDTGSSWRNPDGTTGDVKGIDYVELCSAHADENPPPPVDDGSGGDGGGSGSDENCHGFC